MANNKPSPFSMCVSSECPPELNALKFANAKTYEFKEGLLYVNGEPMGKLIKELGGDAFLVEMQCKNKYMNGLHLKIYVGNLDTISNT